MIQRRETPPRNPKSGSQWAERTPRTLAKRLAPSSAAAKGVAGEKEYTALLFSDYHLARLNPRTVTAKGEEVWGVFDAEALHRPSGRYARFDMSLHWRMKDGQIAEQQCFFDTASVLIQQGDLATEAA